MGFVKAGSKASLIGGIATGLLAATAALLHPGNRLVSLITGLAVSQVASVIFIMRYKKTGKAMPAIPMILMSEAVFLVSLVSLLKHH